MSFSCPICFDLLSSEDEPRTGNCGHVFHGSCLSDWLKKRTPNVDIDGLQGSCPICLKQIQWKQTIKLFFWKEQAEVQQTGKKEPKMRNDKMPMPIIRLERIAAPNTAAGTTSGTLNSSNRRSVTNRKSTPTKRKVPLAATAATARIRPSRSTSGARASTSSGRSAANVRVNVHQLIQNLVQVPVPPQPVSLGAHIPVRDMLRSAMPRNSIRNVGAASGGAVKPSAPHPAPAISYERPMTRSATKRSQAQVQITQQTGQRVRSTRTDFGATAISNAEQQAQQRITTGKKRISTKL